VILCFLSFLNSDIEFGRTINIRAVLFSQSALYNNPHHIP
jgi:hypothetical protein